ncbi:hypothetical protein [Streptomyces lydicus]|uniref:hypothetical protein n=1 Tax=Streptomyces lydicus TaxID=47763 RepID=UPI0032676646
MHAEVELGAGVRDDGGRGAVDGRRVQADDGEGGAAPEAFAEAAGAGERGAGDDAGEFAELLLGEGGAVPGLPAQPFDGDVAVDVVEGAERLEEGEQGRRGRRRRTRRCGPRS